MISLGKREDLIPFLNKRGDDVFAVKQRAMLEMYGDECGFWVQDGLLLSRLSGVVTLCGEAREEALPELRCFLRSMGQQAEGDAILLGRLFPDAAPLPVMGAPVVGWELLKETFKSFPGARASIPDRLAPVYALLSECDRRFAAAARYDAWLADFSHRCRHGFSRCYILTVDNCMIATFSILFYGKRHSLGGAFAVSPQWRGNGYGALLLAYAAAKEPGLLLIADGENLERYYARRGWKKRGEAARYTLMEEL